MQPADFRHPRALLPGLTAFLAAALFLFGAGAAFAQGPQWVSLDSSAPPGSPTRLELLQAESGPQRTSFELIVPGFWRETAAGADGGTYERIRVPGLGEYGQVGAPELPALRPRLAVVSGAAQVSLTQVVVPPGELFGFDMELYPMPLPGADSGGGPDGSASTPDVFHKDAGLYALDVFWPTAADGVNKLWSVPSADVSPWHGVLPSAELLFVPAHYQPTQGRLEIARRSRFTLAHGGTPTPLGPLARDLARYFEAACGNWPSIAPWIGIDLNQYTGRYLVVTPEHLSPTLTAFLEHRKSTGFQVAVRTLESLPAVTCGEIRAAIGDWYLAGPAGAEHYVLLVGDAATLPLCPSPTIDLIPADKRYASPFGTGSLDGEVFVGRIPTSDAHHLNHALAKIQSYELGPHLSQDYSRALLVAHHEDAPGKYEAAHETVANAAYAVQPLFAKLYGSSVAADNAALIAAVESGRGVVAYRGHGSRTSWSTWNIASTSFWSASVWALAQAQLPVVWAITCNNSALDLGATIAEAWIFAPGGAVAHYGSTRTSGTTKNHTLNARLFEAVFDLGLTTHSHAIAWAEAQMEAAHPTNTHQNAWMYQLLGCPAMKVRRGAPNALDLVLPATVPVDPAVGSFSVVVRSLSGAPLEGILVSAWKAPFDPNEPPDEILAAVYTGPGGGASFPGPTSLGTIVISARDDDGNIAKELVPATQGVFQKVGEGTPGTGGVVPRLQSTASLQPGTGFVLNAFDGPPQAPGLLLVAPALNPLPIFGGIVYAYPATFEIALVTNPMGNWQFSLPAWPAGLPSGAQLVFQAGIADAAAQGGVSMTNALLAVTP